MFVGSWQYTIYTASVAGEADKIGTVVIFSEDWVLLTIMMMMMVMIIKLTMMI